jgi:hypothetical protein
MLNWQKTGFHFPIFFSAQFLNIPDWCMVIW